MTVSLTRVEGLISEMDALIGCLGCGEPVPEDSLSDLFCAGPFHDTAWCPGPGLPGYRTDLDCQCRPRLITCQYDALARLVDDPRVGNVDPFELRGTATPARWQPWDAS